MVKVIETNVILKNGVVTDHQSRVVEVESWESYVEEMRSCKSVYREDFYGRLNGESLFKNTRIENFKADDFHLSFDAYRTCFEPERYWSTHLACLVEE